ncbi:flagellar export protein FliJ [Kerstersia similis]|uniref:flagellar export protein FliJ n=1 Tax=Kerstersia similis TaxID=206505 RepID=UPI0039EEB79D
MAEPTPLDTLIDLARQRVDDALQAFGQAQARYNQARQQLQALYDYCDDYRRNLQQGMGQGMQTATYRNYSSFLDSLDQAIAQQNSLLQSHQQQLTELRQRWLEEKRKLDAYATLAERRSRAADSLTQRREQRAMDEYSARLARQPQAYAS